MHLNYNTVRNQVLYIIITILALSSADSLHLPNLIADIHRGIHGILVAYDHFVIFDFFWRLIYCVALHSPFVIFTSKLIPHSRHSPFGR